MLKYLLKKFKCFSLLFFPIFYADAFKIQDKDNLKFIETYQPLTVEQQSPWAQPGEGVVTMPC